MLLRGRARPPAATGAARRRARGMLHHSSCRPSPATRFLGRPRAAAHGGPVSAPPTPARGGWGARRCETPRQTCPRAPEGAFGRNLRSKTRWFTGFCNSHQVSHFATFFIDARAEISVAESRFDSRKRPPPRVARGRAPGACLLVGVLLGASRAGVRCRRRRRARRPREGHGARRRRRGGA